MARKKTEAEKAAAREAARLKRLEIIVERGRSYRTDAVRAWLADMNAAEDVGAGVRMATPRAIRAGLLHDSMLRQVVSPFGMKDEDMPVPSDPEVLAEMKCDGVEWQHQRDAYGACWAVAITGKGTWYAALGDLCKKNGRLPDKNGRTA